MICGMEICICLRQRNDSLNVTSLKRVDIRTSIRGGYGQFEAEMVYSATWTGVGLFCDRDESATSSTK